jgi:hypothetical protein
VDLACRVSVPGQEPRVACVIDISEGGAWVKADRSWPQGTRGTLHVDNADLTLSFTVVAAEGDDMHLRFALDESKTSEFASIIERLPRRRAA